MVDGKLPRVLSQLSELGQYLANIPFDPPPPVPFLVPSLIQRCGHLRDSFCVNGGCIIKLCRSCLRAKEVGFNGDPNNIWEGRPDSPVARVGSMAVG